MADITDIYSRTTPDTAKQFFNCLNCGIFFNIKKSSADLKISFCGFLCELGKNGILNTDWLLYEKNPALFYAERLVALRETPVAEAAGNQSITPSDDDRELVYA